MVDITDMLNKYNLHQAGLGNNSPVDNSSQFEFQEENDDNVRQTDNSDSLEIIPDNVPENEIIVPENEILEGELVLI